MRSKIQVKVRLPTVLHLQLQATAKAKGVTVTQLINEALAWGLSDDRLAGFEAVLREQKGRGNKAGTGDRSYE